MLRCANSAAVKSKCAGSQRQRSRNHAPNTGVDVHTIKSPHWQNMFPVPTSYFLTKGVGVHRERLTAFELALRDADIEQQNLVSVSSILPPRCEQVEREHG